MTTKIDEAWQVICKQYSEMRWKDLRPNDYNHDSLDMIIQGELTSLRDSDILDAVEDDLEAVTKKWRWFRRIPGLPDNVRALRVLSFIDKASRKWYNRKE